MKYILDTNTLSYLMGGRENVISRLLAHKRSDILLPQPVVAEIEYGITRLRRSRKRNLLRVRFETFRTELGRVPWTDSVSNAFARIKTAGERSGQRLEDFDIAVAAHAIAFKATLVSSNTKHMSRVRGLRLQDWNA